jgi:hypothetical protein
MFEFIHLVMHGIGLCPESFGTLLINDYIVSIQYYLGRIKSYVYN